MKIKHSNHYQQRIFKVLEYVEHNLDGELSLTSAASLACWSPYHFMRVFLAATGHTYRDYVCRRRMESAAYRLVFSTESIVDIAVSLNYDSQEAFSRAFKRVRSITPGSYRKSAIHHIQTANPQKIYHSLSKYTGVRMSPKIIRVDEFSIMGPHIRTRADGSNHQDIPSFWQRFMRTNIADKIKHKRNNRYLYGLCTDFESTDETFSYVIGFEVDRESKTEDDLGIYVVNGGSYAVFSAAGDLDTSAFSDAIQDVWHFIYREWFASQKNWKHDDPNRSDFELYDRSRITENVGYCDIYIPVVAV